MPGPCEDSEEILNIFQAFWVFGNEEKPETKFTEDCIAKDKKNGYENTYFRYNTYSKK